MEAVATPSSTSAEEALAALRVELAAAKEALADAPSPTSVAALRAELAAAKEALAISSRITSSPTAGPAAPAPAAPAARGLGEVVAVLGELSFTSPRGKAEVVLYKEGLQLRAKAFTLSIPAAALRICCELDLGNRGGLTCLLQLDASAVSVEGQPPKGAKEFCVWTRKPTDLDMRAKLEACGVGPSWIDSTSFKLDKGQAFVNCYVKATEVQLVPLDAHILVLGKPTLCVAYDEADVSIPEAVGGRKTFDVGLAFTNADGKVAYELSMVPAQAHAGLFDFIRRKKREAAKRSKAAAGDAGENREAAAADGTAGDEEVEDEVEDDEDVDDSDDDEDDDFNPGEGSEPEEEYDSDGGVPQDGSIRDYDDAAADDTDEGEDEDEDEDEPACKKAKPETDAAHDEL